MNQGRMWTVRDGEQLDLRQPVIMGIVNCTPDSFFDGGRLQTPEAAVEHGLALAGQGALIIDVGGESTRPGALPVDSDEELRRVVPVLANLARLRASNDLEFTLSVDTSKAEVASAALTAGAAIVNDVSACRFDPGLVDVLVQYQPGYVLMHSLGRPETMQCEPVYTDVVDEILDFFVRHLSLLVAAGLSEEHVVLDPGVGFGKLLEHNIAILRNIDRFFSLGRPVLVGVSNKSLWQGLLGLGPADRGVPTQVATALLAARGVAVHRVHDAGATQRTLRIANALSPLGTRP